MIKLDDYTIEEYTKQNKIVITIPQTFNTCTNTLEPIARRKDKLSDTDKLIILSIIKTMYSSDKDM